MINPNDISILLSGELISPPSTSPHTANAPYTKDGRQKITVNTAFIPFFSGAISAAAIILSRKPPSPVTTKESRVFFSAERNKSFSTKSAEKLPIPAKAAESGIL